jgi:hypothetical protein
MFGCGGEGDGPGIKAGPSVEQNTYGLARPDFSPVTPPKTEVTDPLFTRLSGDKTKNQNHERTGNNG